MIGDFVIIPDRLLGWLPGSSFRIFLRFSVKLVTRLPDIDSVLDNQQNAVWEVYEPSDHAP